MTKNARPSSLLGALLLALGVSLMTCATQPGAGSDAEDSQQRGTAPSSGASAVETPGQVEPGEGGSASSGRQPPASSQPSEDAAKKLSLLVGIADYERAGLGWGNLSADRDVEVLQRTLERHHFDEVRVLLDREATRAGILGALRDLIADASSGDVVHFHYSGHGQQITDDDGDEIDGYDELLVPYDAPHSPGAGYAGESHVRDDELAELLAELRSRLGERGDLLVTLDSCYSGSGTRGEAAVRGSQTPIGAPRSRAGGAALGSDSGVGFADGGTSGHPTAAELTPYAVFTAARHNELAFETRDRDGKKIGSLSWALAAALEEAGKDTHYTALFERARKLMDQKVRNRPQSEGNLDRTVFGGRAVDQEPFFRVSAANLDTAKARIEGGALAGLLEGTEVEIHEPGSRGPAQAQPLAKGVVYQVATTTSDVDLTEITTDQDLAGSWAFVTAESFGTLQLKTRLSGVGASWRTPLEEALRSSRFVELVAGGSEPADVALEAHPASDSADADPADSSLIARRADDGTILLGPLPADTPDLVAIVHDRIRDLARNLYLRRLELETATIDVEFQLEPCRLDCSLDPITGRERCRCVDSLPFSDFETAGGQLELRNGDGFRLRVVNRGSEGAHFAILDLKPDGRIGLLWPPFSQSGASDNFLARGREFPLPVSYRIEGNEGTEVYKLVATRDFVDFRAILSADARSGQARGGALDELFGDLLAGARTGGWSEDGVSTFEVAFSLLAER